MQKLIFQRNMLPVSSTLKTDAVLFFYNTANIDQTAKYVQHDKML